MLAAAAALGVQSTANAQPLATSGGTARRYCSPLGFLITFSQIGYGLGLAVLVPLGDLIERRRLVTTLLGLSVLALIAAAFSPTLAVLASASLFIGLTAVVAQIIVPFAASLAAEHEQGRVGGIVMSGLLIGILLARTVTGFVGEIFGWRAIYALAALLTSGLAGVLWRELPEYREHHLYSYLQLLRSVWRLVREERVLRYRSIYGASVFASFSVFWTTAAFLLVGPRRDQYSDRIIGLFGLLGVAGVVAASAAGRLADRVVGTPANPGSGARYRGLLHPGLRCLAPSVLFTA